MIDSFEQMVNRLSGTAGSGLTSDLGLHGTTILLSAFVADSWPSLGACSLKRLVFTISTYRPRDEVATFFKPSIHRIVEAINAQCVASQKRVSV